MSRSTAESKVRRFNLLFAVALKKSYISFSAVALKRLFSLYSIFIVSVGPDRAALSLPVVMTDNHHVTVYKVLLNPHQDHFNREDEAVCFSEILATQHTST